MFQNLMSGSPYTSTANQDAAYLQAMYRPHAQYSSPPSADGSDQSIRASPSWSASPPAASITGQSSSADNYGSGHNPSPFSSRFPFQSAPVASASCSVATSSSPSNTPSSCGRGTTVGESYFRSAAAMNGLHPYSYAAEAAAAAAAACAWAGRLDPSAASLGRLDPRLDPAAAAAGFQAGLAASQVAAFGRRSGKANIFL